ncbi:FAD-binding domain-containing protein [Roridomyces roridus]|uniref:FAD-binding domain-containing protein n=1 Tax=Roridomyces roridus TaxID=1738132 RepID=A0AAD7FAP5_9AGAR|nr:FAD-binding domain-containing protein [Roridomyces roridus]
MQECTPTESNPVLIIGGGIVGLALAQALRRRNVPFIVFERALCPPHDTTRGWGITIHWALPALQTCLPEALFAAIDSVQPTRGRFLFLDISTAEPRYSIPPAPRKRVSRVRLQRLLADGLDVDRVQYGMKFVGFEFTEDGEGVEAEFADGSKVSGCMLIGADGSTSRVRRLLVGEESGRVEPVGANSLGVTVRMTEAELAPLRAIDPLLFQGSHPDTGKYMWFSILSTPEANGSGSSSSAYYEAQINVSWLATDVVPASNKERLALIKEAARAGSTGFHQTFRDAIERIPEDTKVVEAKIADWPTVRWVPCGGRVTLAGDAAHAMTMYRGEAANHGITDVAHLVEQLRLWQEGKKTRAEAVGEYEDEMIPRAYQAVLLSRQACLDAHHVRNLWPDSPLVSKRAIVRNPGVRISG